MTVTVDDLTPTQALCMEVLSARYRLGENLWTMDSHNKKALDKLAEYGLVNVMHGIMPKTVRASLTEEGKKMYLTEGYVSPLERRLASKVHGGW